MTKTGDLKLRTLKLLFFFFFIKEVPSKHMGYWTINEDQGHNSHSSLLTMLHASAVVQNGSIFIRFKAIQ